MRNFKLRLQFIPFAISFGIYVLSDSIWFAIIALLAIEGYGFAIGLHAALESNST